MAVASVLLYVFVALLIPILFHFTKYLGPNSKSGVEKNRSYESGIVDVYGGINASFNVKYYLVAIAFLIFDIEVIFMYPWALALRDLGIHGLIAMFLFMTVLIIGLVYVYQKKILRWA